MNGIFFTSSYIAFLNNVQGKLLSKERLSVNDKIESEIVYLSTQYNNSFTSA